MAISRPPTVLLPRQDVATLLDYDTCIAAVEQAFHLAGDGKAARPGILGLPAPGGGFHIKAASLSLDRSYVAVKVNANFPQNRLQHTLPTIQGVVVLADAETGCPLSVLDSGEITLRRTAAATAVATQYLARPDSGVATICGCGVQERAQLAALARVCSLRHVYAVDTDRDQARQYAEAATQELGIPVEIASSAGEATRHSDICVTCTPSRRFFLRPEDVQPGTFIAAVGADCPEKQELDPALLARSTVVVDIIEQAATIGDLHHALDAGVMTLEDVHAELGEVVAGRMPGRTSAAETIVFDSTGTAWQDVAAAAIVYEKAIRVNAGTLFDFLA